ncbi:MAG: TlpA disulfide reductase family protein [Bacteroidota bacterium]|nr:TlpA disulfide reductase family protein [Bacteroidota bacterium]MDP4232832.1 TlpA disulfide reductase family protein [Bacteroidota bacterium]MDP4241876.1 TlpA disulfide reductase family protein [Bacteroidota bacterium]MDP4288201.1 TlpA disulfide reductase family protein [Bacteroidota bacterium]
MKIRTPLVIFAFLLLGRASFAQSATDSVHIQDNLKFTVKTVQGDEVNFKDYLGKGPVLIDFWALWCEPCKQEMKAFKTIQEKFKAEGVNLIAINTDQVRNLAKVRAYITTQGFQFPVLVDPDGSIARDIFSMESLPFSLVLMPDGTIYRKHIGYTAGDEKVAEQEVIELIDKLKKKS